MDNNKQMINPNCTCPNLGCKIHGDCVKCRKRHRSFWHRLFNKDTKTACEYLNEKKEIQ